MENPKIFIAGHNGMVGSALVRLFKKKKQLIQDYKKGIQLKNNNEQFYKYRKVIL